MNLECAITAHSSNNGDEKKMEKFAHLEAYNPNNIRVIADRLSKKYRDLERTHVFWIAKEIGIYPDAVTYKKKKSVHVTKMGKNNRICPLVTDGRLNESGIHAIETFLETEGYVVKIDNGEEKMAESKSVWEQVDLISAMKLDYEKVVAERDKAKEDAESYAKMAEEYDKIIEDLKDKLLVAERENSNLKTEKQQLSKMQIESVDFEKEIDNLQVKIGRYSQELNTCLSEINELRKGISVLQTRYNSLQDNKKKLDGVLSDLVGCSKRLMNIK